MSTSDVIRASKDLHIHHGHGVHTPTHAADFLRSSKPKPEEYLPDKSYEPSSEEDPSSEEEEEEEEEDDESSSDRSLSDYHSEEYGIRASDSESSEEDEAGMKQSPMTPPIKKMKTEDEDEDAVGDEYFGGCDVKEPSQFPLVPDLSSLYVSWLSVSPGFEYSVPDKESWIKSWSLVKDAVQDRKGYNYLDVYGFHKKKTGMGGYGVMLRDPCGRPVAASSSVQPQGKFYFFHVLDGVKAGLELALERKTYDVTLVCNSAKLDRSLCQIFQQADIGSCKSLLRTRYQCGTCDKCLRFVIPLNDKEFKILVPILRNIIDLRLRIMKAGSRLFHLTNTEVCATSDEAAYYVAKQHALEMKNATKPSSRTIEPADFQEDLKTILYEDAHVGAKVYSDQMRHDY